MKNFPLRQIKNIFEGRIGRVDFYLALVVHSIAILGFGCFIVRIYELTTSVSNEVLIILFFSLFMLLLVSVFVSLSFFSLLVRRLHDLNTTGWKSILIFVPLVNFFMALYLFFYPGTKGKNLYGDDRSDDPFISVLLNYHGVIGQTSVIYRSKKRQMVAWIVLVLHAILIFFLV